LNIRLITAADGADGYAPAVVAKEPRG